jgi:hypothetical protein
MAIVSNDEVSNRFDIQFLLKGTRKSTWNQVSNASPPAFQSEMTHRKPTWEIPVSGVPP